MTVTKITGIICSEGASAWRPRNLEHRPIICPEIVPIICLVGSNYYLPFRPLLREKKGEFLILFPEHTRRSEESRRGKEKGVLRKRRKTTGPHIFSDAQAHYLIGNTLPIICLVRILPIIWNVCRTHAAKPTLGDASPALSLHCCATFRFWASCWRVNFFRFPSWRRRRLLRSCCLERSNGFNLALDTWVMGIWGLLPLGTVGNLETVVNPLVGPRNCC